MLHPWAHLWASLWLHRESWSARFQSAMSRLIQPQEAFVIKPNHVARKWNLQEGTLHKALPRDASGSFSAQEFYNHHELLTTLSMTDLLDLGRNVIPALPRRGARSNDWSCSKRIKEPSPVRGTSTWNSNMGIGQCRKIFIRDPCLCLSGGYEPLKLILICGNAYFSWIRTQHFQQIPKGVSEPPQG